MTNEFKGEIIALVIMILAIVSGIGMIVAPLFIIVFVLYMALR